jgi:hypothetical protein
VNIHLIIEHLREHCLSFQGRVAGAARFKRLDETVAMQVPSAYVIPQDETAGERMNLNDIRQPLLEVFSVIVVLSNEEDERGQSAIHNAHESIRAEIWRALLGWQPAARYQGIEYQGGSLLDLDRSRLWYQFDFAAYMEISPEEGWQEIELNDNPHFDGLTINLDGIDPEADPNLQYPGPDGRIEHVITSPKTGTLE